MSKQYAHLHAMAKTSVKFQNDWPKTVGGVALTSQLLTNGQMDKSTNRRVTAHLYRTCVLTQVLQKQKDVKMLSAEIFTQYVALTFDLEFLFNPV